MDPKFRRRGDVHASLFDTEETKKVKVEKGAMGLNFLT